MDSVGGADLRRYGRLWPETPAAGVVLSRGETFCAAGSQWPPAAFGQPGATGVLWGVGLDWPHAYLRVQDHERDRLLRGNGGDRRGRNEDTRSQPLRIRRVLPLRSPGAVCLAGAKHRHEARRGSPGQRVQPGSRPYRYEVGISASGWSIPRSGGGGDAWRRGSWSCEGRAPCLYLPE